MTVSNEFEGCKVIIYNDTDGTQIAESTVLGHDKKKFSILVDNRIFEITPCDRVSLLILHSSGIYEFKGTVRKMGLYGRREIALFQGKEKESRTTKRYTINVQARVENLAVGERLLPLRTPKDVIVMDVSTEGVRVKTSVFSFNVGTTFELKLPIGGSVTKINTSVVRIKNIDGINAEYGCKFNFLYPQEG